MPSDMPLNKRRTHYDLDRHFELFLEANSLDAVTTKKTFLHPKEIKHRPFSQSMHPIKLRTEAPPITIVSSNNVFWPFFFRKPKHAARFGQWKNCLEIHLWQTAVCRSCTITRSLTRAPPCAWQSCTNYKNFADMKEGVEWTDVA